MKKKKFNKKLSLNKESIANLNSSEMRKVNGGKHQHALVTDESIDCPPETENLACISFPINTCWMC